MFAFHFDRHICYAETDGAQVIIKLRSNFNNVLRHLSTDSFSHGLRHEAIGLDESWRHFSSTQVGSLVKF